MELVFTKSDALEDLYIKKNAVYTKHPIEKAAARPLMFNNLINMATEEPLYKTKRKALAGAFFKSKMGLICTKVKESVLASFRDL